MFCPLLYLGSKGSNLLCRICLKNSTGNSCGFSVLVEISCGLVVVYNGCSSSSCFTSTEFQNGPKKVLPVQSTTVQAKYSRWKSHPTPPTNTLPIHKIRQLTPTTICHNPTPTSVVLFHSGNRNGDGMHHYNLFWVELFHLLSTFHLYNHHHCWSESVDGWVGHIETVCVDAAYRVDYSCGTVQEESDQTSTV